MLKNLTTCVDEILSSDDPSTEAVFASDQIAGAAVPGGQAAELETLTDEKLKEKIQRLTRHLNSPGLKLPDGGVKLRNNIAQLLDEQKRRSIISRMENGECKKVSEPSTPGPFEWKDDEDDIIQYTKYRPLRTNKFYSKSGGAFSKELSLIGGEKLKTKEKKNKNQIYSTSRKQPSRSFSRSYSCSFNKRKKVQKPISLDSDSPEVSHVVLLDDDEVETLDPPCKEIPENWKECKMYYPSRDDPEAIELTYSDIRCLDPAEYLSSPVMNFYIYYLKRSLSRGSNQSFYIFNTYFYQKLEDAFNAKAENGSMFVKLRRWWKGINIFEKAYIILPIHGRMHWSLIIICIPSKETQNGPFILHLDSLGCHSTRIIFNTIEWFLRKEWKHVGENSPKNFLNKIHKEKVSVPQQKNEYDCGLFVLYFIERFIRESPRIFLHKNLDMFSRKWFKPEEASGLRQRIRALLLEELESSKLEDENIKSDVISDTSDSD